MIEYPLGTSGQVLVIDKSVVDHLKAHRQLRWFQKEAGGQLFATFEGKRIVVREATGPRPSDKRSRWSYKPDRAAEQAEINVCFGRGLHFIGDWHTHPEGKPHPSGCDQRSIRDTVSSSSHQLNGFLLVLVGKDEPPDGLHVSIHSTTENVELRHRDASIPNS